MKSLPLVVILLTASKLALSQDLPPPPARRELPAGTQKSKPEWKPWSPEGSGFSVEMPGIPTKGIGDYSLHSGLVLYRVGYRKTPPTNVDPTDGSAMKVFWDRYVKAMETGEGIRALAQADFQKGSAIGREVVFEEADIILVNRYLFSQGVLYVLITATYKEYNANPDVKKGRVRFLESFVFLDDSAMTPESKKP